MNDIEKLKSILIWLKEFELPISPILQFSIEDKIEELQAAGVDCEENQEEFISDTESVTEVNTVETEEQNELDADYEEDEIIRDVDEDSTLDVTSDIVAPEPDEYRIYGPMLYRNGELVYRTSGKIIQIGDKFYRLYYTYNGFTVSDIDSTKAGTFTTGKTLIYAGRGTALHFVLSSSTYHEQVEDIHGNSGEYKIKVLGEWYLSDGSSEYKDEEVAPTAKITENKIERFTPAGKIRFICDNLESFYDYLWMLAVTDLLREADADNIMTYDNLAAMMIANAWEMAYNIPTVKDYESEIVECIDFLMSKSKREVGISLSWSSTKQEVYDALKDFPMYGVYEDLVDKMVDGTPFHILKTWFGNDNQVRMVERSQSFEESCLYGIFPRKYDPHIQINSGWKKYFCRKNAELLHYFCEKYLTFIGGSEDDVLLLDYFLPQVEEEQPEDSKAEIDDTLARYAHLLTPQVSETKECNVSTVPQSPSAFAFTPIPRATMRARKKADEAEVRKKAEAAERMERWGTTEEFTVITDEIIDAALTPRGGITRSQLEAVGLSWPKPRDWREQILGMRLTAEELRQFMTIKYAKP